MKVTLFFLFFYFAFATVQAQIAVKDSLKMGYVFTEKDTLFGDTIALPEIIIHKEKLNRERLKEFLLLQNRVYKTYPFAKVASDRLLLMNINLAKLATNKDKRLYFRIIENYMENEFTEKLKKLSRKQGQILVKLICRQTGSSAFDLIKDYKSGWKAFWSNGAARLFDINLKTKYLPEVVNEDFLIETILFRAFKDGKLVKQAAANPIDYYELSDAWELKALKK